MHGEVVKHIGNFTLSGWAEDNVTDSKGSASMLGLALHKAGPLAAIRDPNTFVWTT
jgi:hypothetical protein